MGVGRACSGFQLAHPSADTEGRCVICGEDGWCLYGSENTCGLSLDWVV